MVTPGFPPTELAVVLAPVEGALDPMGAPAVEWAEEGAALVVVDPTSGAPLTDTNRPAGTTAAVTAHFPETYEGSLRGRRVVLRGRTWDVVGDPEPYGAGVGGFNRPVSLGLSEG